MQYLTTQQFSFSSVTSTFKLSLMSSLKVHNAMWPGLVGKEEGTDHPPISLERMLELTTNAEVNGRKYDGIDYFLFHPHTDQTPLKMI